MTLRLAAIACMAMTAPAFALPVFPTETFSALTVPAGWTIQGEKNGTKTAPGTPKSNGDYFGAGDGFGYLRLCEDATYHRASAFYTAQTLRANLAWTLDWSLRIGKTHNGTELTDGADGLAVCLVDASTVDPDDGLTELLGGFGEWLGAPRGGPSPAPMGYHAGLEGWCFVFDHYQSTGDLSGEYTSMRNLSDWTRLSAADHNFVANTSFYYNDGWEDVRLAYDGSGRFDFYWGPSLANSYHWTRPIAEGSYYLGFTAATGGQTAYHEIDNVRLDGTVTPEPSSAALFAAGALLLGLLRRRRAA